MPYEYVLLSPEKVELRYELAGIGSRALATVFDDLLLAVVYTLLAAIGSYLFQLLTAAGGGPSVQAWLWFFGIFAFFAFCSWFGYYIGLELVWNGQTLGKRLLGLRVIAADGTPASPNAIIIRELLRAVDMLPTCFPPTYAVGGTAAFFNPYFQRIGDLVGGTIVVKERRAAVLEPGSLSAPESAEPHRLEPYLPQAREMTAVEYRAIRTFLERRGQLSLEVRGKLSRELVVRLEGRLGFQISPEVAANSEEILEALARRYARERGLLQWAEGE